MNNILFLLLNCYYLFLDGGMKRIIQIATKRLFNYYLLDL